MCAPVMVELEGETDPLQVDLKMSKTNVIYTEERQNPVIYTVECQNPDARDSGFQTILAV